MKIPGYCPMGCGQTLFAGRGGRITCSYAGCPNPGAVDHLLSDAETEHIVVLKERDFVVQHPLRERLEGDLWTCDIHQRITSLDGPPTQLGTYRVTVPPGAPWRWEAI